MANGLEGRNFSRLLQESRQLNARIRAGGHDNVFLPQLQRGLEQIEEHSSQLAAKVASTSELCPGVESKAALFLASKGYDVSNVGARLRKVADIIPGPTSQAAVTFDLDVDSFIQGELDNTVLNMLNRIDQMAIAEAEVIIAERRMNSWDDSKGRVCESLRIQQKGQDYITGKGSAPTGPKVSVYSKVVQALNEARLRGSSLCLPRRFEGALRELEGSDPRGETLIDCWRALQSILGSDEDDNVFEVKDFRSSYLADPKSAESKLWKAQLVGGSRKHLEEMYLRFVDRTLAQYPRDALLGGRPSAVERIRAFCDIKLKRLSPAELSSVEIMDGIALWMILFTLVRCGLLKDALSMAQSMEHVIQRSDPLFFSFLRAFVTSPSNQISGSLLSQLRSEFSNRMTTGRQDPYKMTLLKIIGHCDLSRKTITDVISTSEDYLWLQFWLIQDSLLEESEGPASYSLADLQRTITDFGPQHFDPKQSNPWQYFGILMLVGLFERALEYLYQQGQIIDTVHFALVLLQAGTLRIGKATDPLFTRVGIQGTFVNFGALITSYANSLSTGDISDSVNYLLLLSLGKSSDYDTLGHNSIRDLILKSGDFGSLLGDVRHDGSVMPGSLSQYSRLMNLKDSKEFMDVITTAAAVKCEKEGRFREALQLYNLANKYDRVLEVLCGKLSRAFVTAYSPLECDELRRTAESILNYYTAHTHITATLSASDRNTCAILIQLIQLKKQYEEQHWADGLDLLMKLSIIPLDADITTISGTADRVRDMPDSLTVLLPELLLMAMDVLVRRDGEMRGYIGIDSGRAQQVELLRRMARNLMMFVGMLRLRIPQDVYSQLTRMEMSIS